MKKLAVLLTMGMVLLMLGCASQSQPKAEDPGSGLGLKELTELMKKDLGKEVSPGYKITDVKSMSVPFIYLNKETQAEAAKLGYGPGDRVEIVLDEKKNASIKPKK